MLELPYRDNREFGIENEFFNLMCNEYLGGGCFRNVYSIRLNPTMVVKFEKDTHTVMIS